MKIQNNTKTVPSITRRDDLGGYVVSQLGATVSTIEKIPEFYFDRESAERAAFSMTALPQAHLVALCQELGGLRNYLQSPKFWEDPTVQIQDVLNRLDQLEHRAGVDASRRVDALLAQREETL